MTISRVWAGELSALRVLHPARPLTSAEASGQTPVSITSRGPRSAEPDPMSAGASGGAPVHITPGSPHPRATMGYLDIQALRVSLRTPRARTQPQRNPQLRLTDWSHDGGTVPCSDMPRQARGWARLASRWRQAPASVCAGPLLPDGEAFPPQTPPQTSP